MTDIKRADAEEYTWNVDLLTEKLDIYQIKGWIIRKGEDIDSSDISLIVLNEDGSAYLIPTEMEQRTDVTEALNKTTEIYDYDASGFAATINKHYVDSANSRLYILYGNNERYEWIDISTTFEID